MHQDGLSGRGLMTGVEHEPRRERLNRERGALFEADEIGQGNNLVRIEQRVLGVGFEADRRDAHARLQALDARAHFVDHAGRFHPGRVGQLGLDEIGALAKEGIGEVDSRRMHMHPHHAGSQFGLGYIDQLHDVGPADFLELNCFQLPSSVWRGCAVVFEADGAVRYQAN